MSRAIKNHYADCITEKILHTGQHYDANMSQVFFDELGIPAPNFNLHVGSGSHGEQTSKMISGIEQVLLNEHFDALVVYGDTNSTLAGAVAAGKLHIPIVHIEAGLRSYNMSMPEEQNRIVCDHLSSLLFSPTQTGMDNLATEGFEQSKAVFANGKGRQVLLSGDIMYDNSLYFAKLAEQKRVILTDNNLESDNYVLATIHRDNNTDDPVRLKAIFDALTTIATEQSITVVLPLHPRTAKKLKDYGMDTSVLQIIPPASFLEMIVLEKNAKLVMTDSGGVQKEAYYFKKPCVILRPETEWVEIIKQGAGILTDADYKRIVEAYMTLSNAKVDYAPIFGNGNASEFIIEKILEYLS